MQKSMGYYLSILTLSTLLSVPAYSNSLDIKEGKWSWSMSMEMMGMMMPPVTYDACVTKDDVVPQQQNQADGCKILQNKISNNTVTWKVECRGENGKSTSTGKLIYTKTTANGEIVVTTQGASMVSKLKGKYIGGSCK